MTFVCPNCSPDLRHQVDAPTCRIIAYCPTCRDRMHPLPVPEEGAPTVRNGTATVDNGTVCGYCHHTMTPRHNKVYCSDACRYAAHDRDHKGEP